jgi:hypothetical protein
MLFYNVSARRSLNVLGDELPVFTGFTFTVVSLSLNSGLRILTIVSGMTLKGAEEEL